MSGFLTKTSRKIVILVILSVVATASFVIYFEYNSRLVSNISLSEEMKMISTFALNSFEPIRQEYRKGEISKSEAVKQISERIKYFSYDEQGSSVYIFMKKNDGTLFVMPQLIREDLIEDFIAAGKSGGGLFNYEETDGDTGRRLQKTAYIVELEDIGCYIGIIDHSSAVIQIAERMKARIIIFFFIFISVLVIMNYIIVLPVLNSVRYITGKINSLDKGVDIESLFTDNPRFRKNSDEEILVRKFKEITLSLYKKSDRTIHVLREKNKIRNEQIKNIEHTLSEKDMMLKEINHRVKNNLQVIISLLRIQLPQHREPVIQETFLETINRLESISMVHSMLYRNDNYSILSAEKYLKDLSEFIIESLGAEGWVKIILSVDKTGLSVEQAVSIGIIINEAVTNSIKFAFSKKQKGIIKISLITENNAHYFSISDNGKGIPDEYVEGKASGLGITLIRNLSRQLKAELEVNNSPGASYRLKFN